MKETTIKVILTTAIAGVTAYLGHLMIPIVILAIAMMLDYCTGLTYAWINHSLSSRQGVIGIIKKIGYLMTVAVAMIVDWIIAQTIITANMDFSMPISFGMIVVIWLIINELISILENLSKIGVPLPKILTNVVAKLKTQIDEVD